MPAADPGTALTPPEHLAARELHRINHTEGLVHRAGCRPRRYRAAARGQQPRCPPPCRPPPPGSLADRRPRRPMRRRGDGRAALQTRIYHHALATGFSMGYLISAGILVLAVIIALARSGSGARTCPARTRRPNRPVTSAHRTQREVQETPPARPACSSRQPGRVALPRSGLGASRPRARARATVSARVCVPSLAYRWRMWVLTVLRETYSSLPICAAGRLVGR